MIDYSLYAGEYVLSNLHEPYQFYSREFVLDFSKMGYRIICGFLRFYENGLTSHVKIIQDVETDIIRYSEHPLMHPYYENELGFLLK